MRRPIIALKDKRVERGQHAGLLLQRYLCENATGDDGNPEEKRAVLLAAIAAAKDQEVRTLYRHAFHRWSKSLPTYAGPVDLVTAGRLIVGLGSENVLETGIRLHHAYGLPVIPGSALKGLAAHYCDWVWGERHTETPSDEATRFRGGRREDRKRNQPAESPGDYHQLLFGATDDGGGIVFHDAWYVPDSSRKPLVLDVMTPHHPKWQNNEAPPTDFDSPKPVLFLSVTGRFRIAVAWHGPPSDESTKWTQLALSLLKQALAEWGIGGKTSSGYGRLVVESRAPVGKTTRGSADPKAATPTTTRPVKRKSGTQVRVRIVGTREKGSDVQEEGRPQGTLTVGSKPDDVEANIGDEVAVEVHNDDANKPQYRWPSARSPRKKNERGKRKR